MMTEDHLATPTRFLIENGEWNLTPNLGGSISQELNPFECNFQQRFNNPLVKLSIDTYDHEHRKTDSAEQLKASKELDESCDVPDNNSLPPTPPMSLTQSPVNTAIPLLTSVSESSTETTMVSDLLPHENNSPASVSPVMHVYSSDNMSTQSYKEVTASTHSYPTRKSNIRKESLKSIDYEDDDYPSRSSSHSGRKRRIIFDGDDAEDRRKKFLERNRIAAYKCRQKKKSWVMELEKHAEIKSDQNEELRAMVARLKEESIYLRNLLLTHGNCDCESVQTYLRKTSAQITCNPNLGTSLVDAIPPAPISELSSNSAFRQEPPISLKPNYSPTSSLRQPSSYANSFSTFPFSGTSTGLTPYLNTVMEKSTEASDYFIPQHPNH